MGDLSDHIIAFLPELYPDLLTEKNFKVTVGDPTKGNKKKKSAKTGTGKRRMGTDGLPRSGGGGGRGGKGRRK